MNNQSAEKNKDLNYTCGKCGGSLVVVKEEKGRKVYNCDNCKENKLWECTICQKPRSIWADNGNICGSCGLEFLAGRLTLTDKQRKGIEEWIVEIPYKSKNKNKEDEKIQKAILSFAELTRKNHPEFDDIYLFGEGDEERDALITKAFILQGGDCPVCGQFMNIGAKADNTFWFCLKCREQRACTGLKYRKGKAEEELFEKCLERQKFCKTCEGHKECYGNKQEIK